MAAEDYKFLGKQWRALSRPFTQLGKARLDTLDGLDEIEKQLKKMGSGELVSNEIVKLLQATARAVHEEKKRRAESFNRSVTTFILELKREGEECKEIDSSWRIGPLELVIDRKQPLIKFRYNAIDVSSLEPVLDHEDLRKKWGQALQTLKGTRIEEKLLVDSLWNAYQAIQEKYKKKNLARRNVPLGELYPEMRVELVRLELKEGKAGKKIKHGVLPEWAFCYNLDLYRALPTSTKLEKVLSFETGGQREQSKAMTLNGLDPTQPYKSFNYVAARSQQ